MRSFVVQIVFKAVIAFGLLIANVVLAAFVDQSPVLIQSLESKTAEGLPVFNNISYRPGTNRDVWVMQQSHDGRTSASDNWDRIAIVVEHGNKRTARFVQLEPGDAVWSGGSELHSSPYPQEVSKRVACFMCHSNGPRAIRPDTSSVALPISLWNRIRISLWNIRVKTYGLVTSDRQQDLESDFRLQSEPANAPLKVKACTRCHSPDSGFRRGQLTKQNYPAIEFMLKNALMPPPGFAISKDEKAELQRFLGKS